MDNSTGAQENQGGPSLYRPDEVIRPRTAEQPSSAPAEPVVKAPAQPMVGPTSAEAPQPATASESIRQPEQEYMSEPEAPTSVVTGDTITWTASEFIDHQKTSGWYGMLGVAAVVIAAVVWLFTRDPFPSATVFVGIVLLGVYAARKPRQETYMLDSQGITIGNRFYPYVDFRSYTVVPEGAFLSVELMPLKRFAMYVSMYFDPADEDRILDQLSQYLPMEERGANLADSVMRRIHF